jgi:2-aminoadipate transaminase
MDGNSGSNSMRLNFAGVPDEDIREGIRRISSIVGPDTGLLMGALTGSAPERPGAGAEVSSGASSKTDGAELAEVLELPRRPEQDSTRRSQDR